LLILRGLLPEGSSDPWAGFPEQADPNQNAGVAPPPYRVGIGRLDAERLAFRNGDRSRITSP
jgi:hypothetical protein